MNIQPGVKIESMKGDQAVGWVDLKRGVMEVVFVCSLMEFFDYDSQRCRVCLDENALPLWVPASQRFRQTSLFLSSSQMEEQCHPCDGRSATDGHIWTYDQQFLQIRNLYCSNAAHFAVVDSYVELKSE